MFEGQGIFTRIKNDDPDFDISFSDIFAGKMDDIIVTDTIIMPTKQFRAPIQE